MQLLAFAPFVESTGGDLCGRKTRIDQEGRTDRQGEQFTGKVQLKLYILSICFACHRGSHKHFPTMTSIVTIDFPGAETVVCATAAAASVACVAQAHPNHSKSTVIEKIIQIMSIDCFPTAQSGV